MSVAFRSFNRDNSPVVNEVSELTSAILVEEGKDHADAWTSGSHAAEVAGKVLITALERCGALTTPIDIETFRDAVREVEDSVLPLGRIRAEELRLQENRVGVAYAGLRDV